MATETALLEQYARDQDADAFAELVKQYAGLVYGVCLRVTANTHDAEDAAQECFLELARNAAAGNSPLPAWLHLRATSRAVDLIRRASARKRREEEAMAQKADDAPTWAEIAPYVDQALAELPDDLRVPVICHYFHERSQAEIAAELGVNQSTVSRRIERGVDELRSKLEKAGIIASAAILATLLGQNAAVAAPASLMDSLIKMALAGPHSASAGAATASAPTAGSTASSSIAAKVLGTAAGKVAAAVAASVIVLAGVVAYREAAKPKPPQPASAAFASGQPAAAQDGEKANAPAPVSVASPQEAAKVLVSGNTAFSLDLFAKLKKEKGNLFLSPYSISTALAMAYGGARGNTAEQMRRVLRLQLSQEDLHPAARRLIGDLNERHEKGRHELSVANALWCQYSLPIRKEFRELVTANYGAAARSVDFRGATESARQTINEWVAMKTKGRIAELLEPEVIERLTMLVLTNAIYFKAKWAFPFEPDATHDARFTLADGDKTVVSMMRQTHEFRYMEEPSLQALELPYVGEELSMVILLPAAVGGPPMAIGGLAELEKGLSVESLSKWLGRLRKRKVHAYIPKFEMTSAFRLRDVLISMGMKDAFSRGANFTGIVEPENLEGPFYLSAVVHKAYVGVGEKGTEAAAATAGIAVGKARLAPERPVIFRADHPFLFLIRDNKTGSILFLGRLSDPNVAMNAEVPGAPPPEGGGEAHPASRGAAWLRQHAKPRILSVLSALPKGWVVADPKAVPAGEGKLGLSLMLVGPRQMKAPEGMNVGEGDGLFTLWIMPAAYVGTEPPLTAQGNTRFLGSSSEHKVFLTARTTSAPTWPAWQDDVAKALKVKKGGRE